MTQDTRDYLAFRRMITPGIIQIVFWILIGVTVLGSVIGIFAGIFAMFTEGVGAGLAGIVLSIIYLVAGIVFVRIYCELIILFFRVNETLTEIKNLLANSNTDQSS